MKHNYLCLTLYLLYFGFLNPANATFSKTDLPILEKVATHLWLGKKLTLKRLPQHLLEPTQGIYIAFRYNGRRQYHLWRYGNTILEALITAITDGRNGMSAKKRALVNQLEIAIAHNFQELSYHKDYAKLTAKIDHGIHGLSITYGNKHKRYSPTLLLARNRKISKQLRLVREEWGLDKKKFATARFHRFEAEQILVTLGHGAKLMKRGNQYISLNEVTQENTQKLADLMITWLKNNLHKDGRMTYKYWPSAGKESDSNNMIRQWMASVVLDKIAANEPHFWAQVERNIDYNLQHFYHQIGKFGLIQWRERVKLGALALATLAIIEHKKRQKWVLQEKAMLHSIDKLWHENGAFSSYLIKPAGALAQQNFYPGEALLLWSKIFVETKDHALLSRIMKSFHYYRNWHRSNRNPAFIPWHTQAYYQVWTQTQNDSLKDFIFEMNDWLLSMQQWDEVKYPDIKGRFYDPKRPKFGPPHASSTGVYLESLIDAYSLAKSVGDQTRANKYRISILRGLRSLMQLQFQDDIDMYYISKRKPVYGGLRTNIYNNEIRCDNIQHGLLAVLKILRVFKKSDFKSD